MNIKIIKSTKGYTRIEMTENGKVHLYAVSKEIGALVTTNLTALKQVIRSGAFSVVVKK